MSALLEMSAIDRLRWLICREFNILPPMAAFSDADCLLCGANMLLDRRRGAFSGNENPDFDEEKFETMKGGGA